MSNFDPRFDPAFQPGYDPAKHDAPRRRVTSERATQQQSDAPAPVDDLVETGARQGIGDTLERRSEAERARSTDDALAVPEAAIRARNPLIIALWVISAVLFLAGIYGLRLISDRVAQLASNGDFGGSEYYLLQAYTIISPLLLALGLATAIGTIFLLAARR